jgi:hypothetical protein
MYGMLIDPDDVADEADPLFWQPDEAGGGRVAADKDQLDAAPAVEQRRPLCKGDVRWNDDDVVELRLDFRLALEAVAHALLEVLGVARHLFVGAFVGQHLHRHEVLVAQRVAAMVIGVDQIQKGSREIPPRSGRASRSPASESAARRPARCPPRCR